MELPQAVSLQLENITAEEDGAEIREGYTLNKNIIKEAWARFRPVQNENDPERK